MTNPAAVAGAVVALAAAAWYAQEALAAVGGRLDDQLELPSPADLIISSMTTGVLA